MKPTFKERFIAVDKHLISATRWISYISAACMLIIAAIAFVNVVSSKIFYWSIPENTNIIAYLIIPVVYLMVPNVQLEIGLTNVDLISGTFPDHVQKAINTLAMVMGAIIYGFSAWCSVGLIQNYYVYREMSSQSGNAFALWPFTVLFGIGTLLLALSFIWSIPRIWLLPYGGRRPPEGSTFGEEEKAY